AGNGRRTAAGRAGRRRTAPVHASPKRGAIERGADAHGVSARRGSGTGGSSQLARRAVPGLVSVVAVVMLGGVAVRIGDASLRSAEDDRLAARAELVRTTARGQAADESNVTLGAYAESVPFKQGDDGGNQLYTYYFDASTWGDPISLVALLDRDGRRLA